MSMIEGAVIGVGLLGVAALGGFLVYRSSRRRRNAAALAITGTDGVDEGSFVTLGGLEQWISIRGESRANPVILVLHGGPATSYVSFTPLFRGWEKDFTVVQWDRRGVGKTFGRNGAARTGEPTLERIVEDGLELAELLRARLKKPKIVLLGHSMGSMIGVSMAARRPELFHAYVGTEQIVDMPSNEDVSYRLILERVRARNERKAVAALERIGPPPYKAPRDWGTKQQQATVADTGYGAISRKMPGFLFFSPAYTLKDVLHFIGGQQFCIRKLYSQWMAFSARSLGLRFGLPVIIIQGADDVMTPTVLAAAWLDEIDAPRKMLLTIPGGHLVFATAADAYLKQLREVVRPLAAPSPAIGRAD
jgi:pimeloyl-ACP methyl ester carboxylesterase